MKRALVVGCEGQDGRLLCDQLAAEGRLVTGLGRTGIHGPGFKIAPVNIENRREVERLLNELVPDEIYYLAARHRSSEQAGEPDPVQELQESHAVNTMAAVHFLEWIACRSSGARFFYAGSSHVFGRGTPEPQHEETPFDPESVYGLTKAAGVFACRLYRRTRGVFAAAGLLYNHESPLRRPEFVARKIVRGAVEIQKGLRTRLDLADLSAVVDWGYAPDYVRAMILVMQLNEPDDFVIASGEGHTVQDFVELAFGLLGLDWQRHIDAGRRREAAAHRLVGNAARLRERTGWRPSVTFEQMVKLLIQAEQDLYELHGER